MTKIARDFASWSEYLDYVAAAPRSKKAEKDSETGSLEFTGTKTLADAITLSRKGWPEGVKKILQVSENIEHQLYNHMQLPQIQYDVTGEILDIGRYCAGEPEHWGVWQYGLQEGQGQKYIHLGINITPSSCVPTDTIIARGAVAGALLNLLELAGRRVKVTAISAVRGGGRVSICRVCLKRYDEYLDMDRLAVAVAHPSMERRLAFKFREALPDEFAAALDRKSVV